MIEKDHATAREVNRRSKQRRRPNIDRRRRRCQAYLLWAYVEHRRVADAIDDLATLRQRNPELYRAVVPDDWPLSDVTIRRYWKDIPIALRINARARRGANEESWAWWLRFVSTRP